MTTTSYSIPQQLNSVRLASSSNLSGFYFNGTLNNGVGATLSGLSVGRLSIDSVEVNQSDRLLLYNQTNSNENGIYVVINSGSPISLWKLERSEDFQSLEQLIPGQYFTVDAGAILSGNLFVLTEPLPSSIGSGSSSFQFVNVGNSGTGGPYLTVANNLSDVADKQTAFTNIGLGSGQTLLLYTDSSFPGGIYQLTNPCPKYVLITVNSDGQSFLRLPESQGDTAYSLSQGPTVITNKPFDNTGYVTIQLSDGSDFYDPPNDVYGLNIYLTDNSTVPGSWDAINFVSSLIGVSSLGDDLIYTGGINLYSDIINANVNFTPSNYSPVAGSDYSANSITGNLKGIDDALSSSPGVNPAYGEMYFQGNTTPTSISALNNPVKVTSTYNSGELQNFSQASGTLTYTDTAGRVVVVSADLTATYDGTAQNTSFYIAKNGSVIGKSKQSTFIGDTTPANRPNPLQVMTQLVQNDTLELWVENNDNSNDIIVSDLNFTVHSQNGFSGGSITETKINGMSINGTSGVNSASVISSQEIRIGNLVTGSILIQFNSNTLINFFTVTKSFGGNFTDTTQALGSGICNKNIPLNPPLNDGSVCTRVEARTSLGVRFDTAVTATSTDYLLEATFTYQVI